MDQLKRLTQLWSWLPAFRAVAETEHLPTAAKMMGVSAPALSRAIRLIEKQIGIQLFERQDRRLVLSDAGRKMLQSVRDAMSLVDEGWQESLDSRDKGPLAIAVASGWTSYFLVPAIAELQRSHPDLIPHFYTMEPDQVEAGLLQGRFDLAFVDRMRADRDLRVEPLGPTPLHIYCGPSHPLRQVAHPSMEEVLAHRFVLPSVGQRDGWPPELPRRVGAVSSTLSWAVDLCAHTELLALLPELVESMFLQSRALQRVPFSWPIADDRIYAVLRKTGKRASSAETLLSAVLRRFNSR